MSRDGQPYISPNSLWPPPKLPFPFWVSPQLDRRENRPFLFKHLCGAHFATLLFFTFMHVMGVCTPLLNVRTFKSANRSSAAVVERRPRSGRDVSTCFRSIPFLFKFLRTLLHFFARNKNSTLFFSSDSALFAKNHPGGCPLMTRGQNETTNAKFRRSIPSSRTSHYRWSSGPFGWDGGREGASARKNHWMGCREVTGCNSFQP